MKRGILMIQGLCAVGLLLLSGSLKAQEMHPDKLGRCLYGGLEGGYGFAILGQGYYFNNYERISNGTTQTVHSKTYSLGAGPVAKVYLGFKFSKSASVELGISGQHAQLNYGYTDDNTVFGSDFRTEQIESTMLDFIPAIRFQMGAGKWGCYTRTGIIIGLSVSYKEKWDDSPNAGYEYRYTLENKGGISWGFMQAIGVSYQFTKSISVFGEGRGVIQTWAPERGTYTQYSLNGKDMLGSMTVSEKEFIYLSSFSNPSMNNSTWNSNTLDKPWQVAKRYLPYNCFSLSLGIQFKFGKRFFKENSKYDIL